MCPDDMSRNSYTYNMHDIDENLIINQNSDYLQKKFKLKVNRIKFCPACAETPSYRKSLKSYI